ncbi:MAG: hypothetical protein KDD66_18485, partial [Bdellovibrionales bacterium]|nr:hypothetical protein [Bdellovibrionales bacterium]
MQEVNRVLRSLLVCLVLCITFFMGSALAENSAPYRHRLHLSQSQLQQIQAIEEQALASAAASERKRKLDKPLVMTTTVPYLGSVRLVFT